MGIRTQPFAGKLFPITQNGCRTVFIKCGTLMITDYCGIEGVLNCIAGANLCCGLNSCCDVSCAEIEVQEYFCAEKLVNVDLGLELIRNLVAGLDFDDVLGTDTEDNLLAVVAAVDDFLGLVSGKLDGLSLDIQECLAAFYSCDCIYEVHLRRSHEACYEQVAGIVIEVLRGIDLLNDTVLHNDDSGTKGHSLCLVVCDVDDGGAKSLVKLSDLGSHLNTKLSIQVGKRLVHKEDLRITNDSTTHSDTLSLAAGKSLRLAVKEVSQVKDSCCLFNSLVDLILRNLAELKTECHVIINGHMRIQSVVLEYHRDVSVLGLNVVHELAVDLEFTGRDIFQTCNHSQSGGLSASGRTYENDEFLISDFHVEILNSLVAVRINLAYIL